LTPSEALGPTAACPAPADASGSERLGDPLSFAVDRFSDGVSFRVGAAAGASVSAVSERAEAVAVATAPEVDGFPDRVAPGVGAAAALAAASVPAVSGRAGAVAAGATPEVDGVWDGVTLDVAAAAVLAAASVPAASDRAGVVAAAAERAGALGIEFQALLRAALSTAR